MNTNMESEAMSNAAMIGGIISGASLLESRMHQLTGSDEPGLHKLTELLADKLSESVKRQLHYIGAVRNQAAHEADFVITEEEYARFNSALENVKAALDAIGGFTPYLGYSSGDAAENATGAAVTAETPAEDRTDDPVDLAVERELFKEIAGKIAVMGFYPFVGIVQLLWIFAGALLRQGWVVLLTLLYASAVILGIKGWISDMNYGLLYFGAGVFLVVYIMLVIMGIRQPIFKKLPKWVWAIPVLNGLYLPIRWVRDLDWPRVLLSGCGLGSFAGAVILVVNKQYFPAFLMLLFSWACSIACTLLWREKREE